MTSPELRLTYLHPDPLPHWPVKWGVPLPPDQVPSTDDLVLVDATGAITPAQLRVLSPNLPNVPCRVLITAEPTISNEGEHLFHLDHHADAAGTQKGASGAGQGGNLSGAVGWVSTLAEGLKLDNPAAPLLVKFSAWGGPGRLNPGDGQALTYRQEEVSILASGPVSACALVRASLLHNNRPLVELRMTLEVFQHTPVLMCDVLVKHLSEHEWVTLHGLEMHIVSSARPWTQVEYEIRQCPVVERCAPPVHVRSDQLTIRIDRPDQSIVHDSRLLNYNETWLAMGSASSRLVLGVKDFFELFPYGVRVDGGQQQSAAVVELYPQWHPRPWVLAQGCGRTHSLLLGAVTENGGFTPRSMGYAFAKPPLPRQHLESMQTAGAFTELPPYRPAKHARFEIMLRDLAWNRNRGYGKMNWGDDHSPLYTCQMRGKGDVVWNNLEGDLPYLLYCQYVRTGQFFYFKQFLDSVRHWADVDFRDRHADPLKEGALAQHSAGHVTGGASVCHNWAEGFREWHFATGDPRPREVLEKMADWIVRQWRHGTFRTEPELRTVRRCGWGLIQMAAIQEVLARADLEQMIHQLVNDILDHARRHRGLPMTMPTGGTWLKRDNAFHNATVVLGAYACWQLYRRPAMRELALVVAETLMDDRTCLPEGLPTYIQGPEQDYPNQQAATFAMAGLAVAHRLTGEERFIRRGMTMLEYCLDRGMILDHMRCPGRFVQTDADGAVLEVTTEMPNSQLLGYQLRGLLHFLKPAHDTGLLTQLDYRF